MNVGSLFSGIGGIELGFEAEGFHTEWFVECDTYAQTILRKHWPTATIYEDVSKIDWSTVPKVDILTGGFPCQDISNAGKRAGITGSRSSLWKYYCEAIRILRPKYALIENVAALTQRGLNVVLADLAEIGYDAEWYNISASSVGAMHRRERLFILAYPNSSGHICDQSQEQSTEGRKQTQHDSESCCTKVSDTASERLDGRLCSDSKNDVRIQEYKQEWSRKGCEITGCDTVRGESINWSIEPELGRVADGISNRVDRIKCLGNAVVPQCAQIIAQAIKEYEMRL